MFGPGDPARTGRVAFWDPAGGTPPASPGGEPGEADLVVPDEDGFTVRTVPVLRLTPARTLPVLLHARGTTTSAPATAAPPVSAAPATTAAAAPATATTAPTGPPAPATTATATAEPSAPTAPLTATTSAPATTAPASTLADLTGPADDDELRWHGTAVAGVGRSHRPTTFQGRG